MAPTPPATSAVDKTTTSDADSVKKAKNKSRVERRIRHSKARESEGTPGASTSGSSTPLSRASNGDLKIAGASTRTHKLKDNNKGGSAKKSENKTFAEGDDFIPFNFSDPEEEEDGVVTSSKDRNSDRKGKCRETENGNESLTARNSRAEDKASLEVDKSKSSRTSERDWDRGKDRNVDDRYGRRGDRDSNRKRKYSDYDDDYSNKKERMDAASRKCPWVNGLELDQCRNVAEMMHKEVESFVDWISPTPMEDEIRGLIVAQISKVVTTAFPDASIYPFGSYQTKLYLPLGDIDLVILSDAMAYSDKATVLHVLANTLKRNGITSYVTIIAKAKVPIVKFVTTHGRFKVDISINQANGLVSGQIITGFLKDMVPNDDGRESKALRSLVMVTKAFLNQRSMNEVYTGGLGSYAIVCLAVSFLQMHPKIRTGEIDPDKNLGVLVMEFFELYGHHFNYDEVGISLREGGTYFNKRQRGWHAEYKRNMLSIEDPADPSNDISAGSYNFHKVRTAFAGCHGILTSTAYLRAGILSSRRYGQSVHLRNRYEHGDMSILATVMGITQETINHRKLVAELYDKQVIHRIVGVKPLASVVDSNDDADVRKRDQKRSSASSKQTASRAVESAYRRDTEHELDNEDSYRDGLHLQVGDDEGGRYDIGRQPPKKRRKTGRSDESQAVYFTDDDDDTEGAIFVDEEDREYMSDESVEERRPTTALDQLKNDNKRSYWLSKGTGMETGVEDDSS